MGRRVRTLLSPALVAVLAAAAVRADDRVPAPPAAAAIAPNAAIAPGPAAAPGAPPAAGHAGAVWDERAARHLLDRAAFGATSEELAVAVAAGREATVERLFATGPARETAFLEPRPLTRRALPLPLPGDADPDRRRAAVDRVRSQFVVALDAYEAWWVSHLLAADEPLRDRMTLFWHGLIPSNKYTVRFGLEIIEQHQMLRENALGSFRSILRGMARDGAMLRYLDNESNVKAHPNENWARELMELFALGEGHYTEKDVQEAARSFTGWGKDNHRFDLHEAEHDEGAKTVLGVSGRLDGDDTIEAILAQPACAEYLAGRLLLFFEGVAPDAARLAEYAAFLREGDYELSPFLRKLLLDPRFDRDEAVAARIAGPIEFLVGAVRRLRAELPAQVVIAGGAVLGQELFAPTSVKGWESGMAWIDTSTILQRANLAGVLLGQVDVGALCEPEGSGLTPEQKGRAGSAGYDVIRALQRGGWTPQLDLAGLARALLAGASEPPTDAVLAQALLRELLAVPAAPDLLPPIAELLAAGRETAGVADGHLLDDPATAEPLLRRVAHVILSLPEAQLD